MRSTETKIRKVIIARLDSGEDLFDALTTLVKEYYVVSGHFQVMGALSRGRVGVYENGKYEWMEHRGSLEISSCVGNVAVKEGQPLVHCHAVLNDQNGKLIAGHVDKGCIVEPTAEIHIIVHDGEVTRKLDEPSGLWKLNL